MGVFFNFPSSYSIFRTNNYLFTFRVVAVVIPVIIAIILYATFLNRKDSSDLKGFAKVFYDFITFKHFCIAKVLEVLYLLVLLFNTVYGALLLFVSPLHGLMHLVIYNLVARLAFEFIMLIVKIKDNTDNISDCYTIIDDDVNDDEDDYIDVDTDTTSDAKENNTENDNEEK